MARVIRDKWKRQGRTHCDNKPGDHEGIPSTGLVLRPDRSQTLPRPFLAGGQQDLNIVEPVHGDKVHIPAANQAPIIPTPSQTGLPGIPTLPGSGRRPRRRPALVFPGRLLGLGGIPRYFGRRNGSAGKGNASPYQAQLRILRLNVSAVSNGRMARTMRKKTWTVIAVANDTRHLWSCLQKATDAHDAMRQCAAEMGAVDPSNFQIIGAIRGDHDVIASGEDGGPRSGPR